jgi:hypothetical protein
MILNSICGGCCSSLNCSTPNSDACVAEADPGYDRRMSDRLTSVSFTSDLWEWSARENWFFVSVPAAESGDIRDQPRPPRGFGSIRVRATIGSTSWTTSMFPGSGDGSYALPVKASVRTAEGLLPGELVDVSIDLLE